MNAIINRIAFRWNQGPSHQTWLGLAGAFAVSGIIGLAISDFIHAAELLPIALVMVVIVL
jgi:hypothetical protein